jgi:hypothetical protein
MIYTREQLQEALTLSFGKEFIRKSMMEKEKIAFTNWFLEIIHNYRSDKTKEKYKLDKFVGIIDPLYYAWRRNPDLVICKIESYSTFKNYVEYLKERIANMYENYGQIDINDEEMIQNEKELRILESTYEEFYKLLNEKSINVGAWENMSIKEYIIREAKEAFSSDAMIINPPFGKFIDDKLSDSIMYQDMYIYNDFRTNTDLIIEDVIQTYKERLLPLIINYIINKIGLELDELLERTLSLINKESTDVYHKLIMNIGVKETFDKSSSKYSNNYFDRYKICLSGKEFTFEKKVDEKSPYTKAVNIFLINDRKVVNLLVAPDKLLKRSEHLIKKDVKSVNVINDSILEIHYHGHFSPDSIVFDNYPAADELQSFITTNR